jgi:hypothetical protein
MNINQPPNGFSQQIQWLTNAIQLLSGRITVLDSLVASGGIYGSISANEIAFGTDLNVIGGSSKIQWDDNNAILSLTNYGNNNGAILYFGIDGKLSDDGSGNILLTSNYSDTPPTALLFNNSGDTVLYNGDQHLLMNDISHEMALVNPYIGQQLAFNNDNSIILFNDYGAGISLTTGKTQIKSYNERYLEVDDQTGTALFGDIDADWYGTYLNIDSSQNLTKIQSYTNSYLLLNGRDNFYQIGDINYTAHGINLALNSQNNSATINASGANYLNLDGSNGYYQIGDTDYVQNGVFLHIDSTNNVLRIYNTGGNQSLLLDSNNQIYAIGDLSYEAYGGQISIVNDSITYNAADHTIYDLNGFALANLSTNLQIVGRLDQSFLEIDNNVLTNKLNYKGVSDQATVQKYDGDNGILYWGDIDNVNTNSIIALDIANQSLTLSNMDSFHFGIAKINMGNVPVYTSDAAAITMGGLTTGDLYKTTTAGSTFLKIVP